MQPILFVLALVLQFAAIITFLAFLSTGTPNPSDIVQGKRYDYYIKGSRGAYAAIFKVLEIKNGYARCEFSPLVPAKPYERVEKLEELAPYCTLIQEEINPFESEEKAK